MDKDSKIKKSGRLILDFFHGLLIGGAAILPGISGGVLCVAFGIYRPMMALLAHPIKTFKSGIGMFIPVILGWLFGFLFFARAIEMFFSALDILATCLFIGLIAGTLPTVYADAGDKGRSKFSYLALLLSFAAVVIVLLCFDSGMFSPVEPSFAWFFFCGVLWGLSLIIPGMTSSSLIIALNLYEPMTSGIASLAPAVMVPWLLGIIITVAACARLVYLLFARYYSIASHAALGVVMASTVYIIPMDYGNFRTGALAALMFIVGFAVSYFMEKSHRQIQAS